MEEKLFDPVKTLEMSIPVKYSSTDYIVSSMRKEIKKTRKPKETRKVRGKPSTGLFK